jgi:hypothetical protein
MLKHAGLFVAVSAGIMLAGCSKVTVNQPGEQQPPTPPPADSGTQAPAAPAPDTSTAPATADDSTQTPAPSDTSAPAPADQQDNGAYQTFYDSLASQGEWIQTPSYGYVFQPTESSPTWAPYSNGHWVYSDAGWTWVSNDSWGWATDHYGRWANVEGTGWVWVPGTQWAPAWVSWRQGGGYCGWAPLPPASVGIDVQIGSNCDSAFQIGAGVYNFLPQQYMGDPNYRAHYVNRSNNFTIINRTTNITNITVNKTVINNYNGGAAADKFKQVSVQGPSLQSVNATSRKPIQRVSLTSSTSRGPASQHGKTLAVYAPELKATPGKAAKPPKVARQLQQVTENHGQDAAKPVQATRLVKAPAPKPAAPVKESYGANKPSETPASHPAEVHEEPGTTHAEEPKKQPVTEDKTYKPVEPKPESHDANAHPEQATEHPKVTEEQKPAAKPPEQDKGDANKPHPAVEEKKQAAPNVAKPGQPNSPQ